MAATTINTQLLTPKTWFSNSVETIKRVPAIKDVMIQAVVAKETVKVISSDVAARFQIFLRHTDRIENTSKSCCISNSFRFFNLFLEVQTEC